MASHGLSFDSNKSSSKISPSSIRPILETLEPRLLLDGVDFGDAPDGEQTPGYPMLLPNGASHIMGGPWLGDDNDAPDAEADAYDNGSAPGRDGADLSLSSFVVSPSTVTDRQFTSASFVLTNNGPVALISEPLIVDYYLSTDTTFGDADDRKIGDTSFALSLGSGSSQTINLSSSGLANMTQLWTESLVSAGSYYVFADVRLTNPPPADPVSSNNFDRTDTTISYAPDQDNVVARHIFYNNSHFDGNNTLANADDDKAIDASKEALLPGGTVDPANYTSYSRGINGIMVDIDNPTGTPTDTDFGIRVNEAADPNTWSAGPIPTVSVRSGDGVGGSDRVTLIWGDGKILNQWVEVTVLATANTGLSADDVFSFASTVGDCDGDGHVGASDYGVLVSEFGLRGGIGALAADLNGDGRSDLVDFAIMRGAYGNSVLTPTIPTAPPAAPAAPLQSMVKPIAAASAPMVTVVRQPLDDPDESDDSIVAIASAPAVDLLAESLSPVDYISGSQAISGGLPATKLHRTATTEYDLRPLSDDPATDGQGDDLLADILAESALAVPL